MILVFGKKKTGMAGQEPAIEIESTGRHEFKDGEYFISMSVGHERILKLEIEDESNGNKWLGKFEAACKTYVNIAMHCVEEIFGMEEQFSFVLSNFLLLYIQCDVAYHRNRGLVGLELPK